ncbi:MAG: hypothetical protein AAF717_03635 [Bacteroidota bacterium]
MELDNYIEDLLEKYFEATATIAEEEELKRYFAQEEVALHLAQYKPMFNYFSIAEKEQFTKQVPLNTKKKINYGWISAAAAVVLAFGIYFGPDQYKAYQDKKEAEYAYQETKKALNLLAENFGKGREKVAYLNEFAVAKSKVFNEN